jgi:hypothetical protein
VPDFLFQSFALARTPQLTGLHANDQMSYRSHGSLAYGSGTLPTSSEILVTVDISKSSIPISCSRVRVPNRPLRRAISARAKSLASGNAA